MNKYILSLTAAAVLASSLSYADSSLGGTMQQTGTASTTVPTTTTTTSTTPESTQSIVQLKKSDGTTINATVSSHDLNASNMGNTLTVITVTPIAPSTTSTSTTTPTEPSDSPLTQ